MWLLDESLPVSLFRTIEKLGIECQTVEYCQWKGLRNGELVSIALKNGFNCILTKDKLFAQDSARALRQNPTMAVVLITIEQMNIAEYLKNFNRLFFKQKIKPKPGFLIKWP